MDSLLNTSFTPEMSSHSQFSDRRLSRLGSRPPELEQLPCPRCQSTNTKFCYYNNYNLSQPRHFCKSCRRYWTRGGTLRNVPVGGGSRKAAAASSNKRHRTAAAAATPTAAATSSNSNSTLVSCSTTDNDITGQTQTPVPVQVSESGEGADVAKSGSLGSWWSGQMGLGSGLLPLTGLGPGLGYEHGVLDWPMEQLRVEGDGGAAVAPGDTWQIGGGGAEGGMSDGDYLSWPDLAITTPARALK